MQNFTPFESTLGGVIIGLATVLMLLANGRLAGISGFLDQTLSVRSKDWLSYATFIGGLVIGGILLKIFHPQALAIEFDVKWPILVVAGLLVGFGTRLGNGCTSGHGVCGIPRGSLRSILATFVFMGVGIAVVYLTRHLMEGLL